MNESFADWLKKNRFRCTCGSLCGPFPKVIRVKDLGEWAYKEIEEQYLEHHELADWITPKGFHVLYSTYLDYQIAIACLGEKRVEQRLKKVRK